MDPFEPHDFGSSDFDALFPSVAEERRESERRRQAELLLEILDEMDRRLDGEEAPGRPAPERRAPERFVAIDGDGSILRVPDAPARQVDRSKVHTMEDLPRESEWEQVFGKAPQPEPVVAVKSGMRLKDRKRFYHATFADSPGESITWSGPSLDALLFGGAMLLGLLLLFCLFAPRAARWRRHAAREGELQELIRQEVRQQVRLCLQSGRLSAEHFA